LSKNQFADTFKQPLRITTPFLVLLAILLALTFIACAIAGFGSWHAFAADPVRVDVAASLILFAAATPVCGCHIDPAITQDRNNDWIFIPLLLMGLTMGWVSAYCAGHNWWTAGGPGIRWAALTMFLAGVALRLTAIRTLGNRFTVWVAIQENHDLQTTGLYRWIRHPSYTGAILNLLGWAMVFRSIPGIALAAVMGLLLVSRLHAEEKLLTQKFGAEYREYQSRSWKLIPGMY
jgi:protein-S-isoprenylcysteine O-methyltransferase Ste14